MPALSTTRPLVLVCLLTNELLSNRAVGLYVFLGLLVHGCFQNISMYCLLISSNLDIILGLTGWML